MSCVPLISFAAEPIILWKRFYRFIKKIGYANKFENGNSDCITLFYNRYSYRSGLTVSE